MNDKTAQSMTDALIDQIESAARASFRRHQSSIKGQILTAADNYDWHLLHAAYQAGIHAMRAQLAEAQAALKTVMRNAELSKEPCGPDPESPAATRNAKFASLASVAAQGLGMVRGPSLTEHLVEAQRDAERGRWLIEHAFRYANVSLGSDMDGNPYVSIEPRFNIPEPTGLEYENEEWSVTDLRAAIDAAKGRA